jgi:hypothetical protein
MTLTPAASARQFGGQPGAVEPEVLPGDPATSKLEDVEGTEPDLPAVSWNSKELFSDGSGDQVLNDHRVVGIVGVQTFFAVGADIFDQLPVPRAAGIPRSGEPGKPTTSFSMSSV